MKDDLRFTYVNMSLLLCNEALTETWHLSHPEYDTEELKIVNGHTFGFYRVCLQYCFNSEYNKLLEQKMHQVRSKPNRHISSLFRLNHFLYEQEGEFFKEIYLTNQEILDAIIKTDFQEKINTLRDVKFSHSDLHEWNNPVKIKGLTLQEIEEGFEHLRKMYQVLNNCAGFYGNSWDNQVPTNEDRTRNFIKFHSVYQRYYHDNYSRAYSEGYTLH